MNVVQGLVEMIETQRAYEVSSKAITSVDEMLALSLITFNVLF